MKPKDRRLLKTLKLFEIDNPDKKINIWEEFQKIKLNKYEFNLETNKEKQEENIIIEEELITENEIDNIYNEVEEISNKKEEKKNVKKRKK
jgi:hypothetical protein